MTTIIKPSIQFKGIPAAADDAAIFAGRSVPARCKLERRIVWNLISHMKRNGFLPSSVWDGEEAVMTKGDAKAMFDAVFSVDDSTMRFRKNGTGEKRGVYIVLGNGIDCISDYSAPEDTTDGFAAVVDAFDPNACE
jgi:hypothetical protein